MITKRMIYFEIFIISMATLILESTLLRIFAIAEWYHFAFISISIALLGFGASGTFLSIYKIKNLSIFPVLGALFSVSVIIAHFVINLVPFDSYNIAWEKVQILYLLIYYFALCIPFFFSGLCIGLAISSFPSEVNRIYFINLSGSASGCLLSPFLLSILNCPQVIIVISITGMSSIILDSKLKIQRLIYLCFTIFLIYLLTNPSLIGEVRMSLYKDLSIIKHYPEAKIIDSKFNSFSYVNTVQAPGIKYAPNLSPSYLKLLPKQIGITIDGNNLSGIFKEPSKNFLQSMATVLPYEINKRKKVLILEPYTGTDILAGLTYNPDSIIAVEKNPLISDIIKKYTEIYKNLRISIINGEPRSILKRLKEKFDLIQICLSDSFRANFVSSYSLNENYLYTTEAISEYFNLLLEDGMLVISRWLQFPPSEELRVLATICDSIPEPSKRIIAIRTWRTCVILVKKSALNFSEVETAKRFCSRKKFDFIYFPGITKKEINQYILYKDDPYYNGFMEILSGDKNSFYKNYAYNIRPVTDNRPFFFHFFKWRNVPLILKTFGKTMQPFGGGGYLVIFILSFLAITIGAILILLPLKLFKVKTKNKEYKFLIYFFLLGIGYLFFEIPLISKFILILGLPIYAFTVAAFSILFFSGLGSILSANWGMKTRLYLISILASMLFIFSFFISSIFNFLLSQPFYIRVILSILLLLPSGILLGIPFPLGIKIVNEQNPSFIPWAWAINGYTSVIASILALILSISFGFKFTIVCAAIVYLSALFVLHPYSTS